MKFIVILYVIITIIACNKDSDKIICYNDRDVKIRIDIPYGAYINEKCIIEGEVNKPITMQIFVDSIKIGEIFGKDTLSWIPTEDKFHPAVRQINLVAVQSQLIRFHLCIQQVRQHGFEILLR